MSGGHYRGAASGPLTASVVIPAYNAEATIAAAISSVQAQTEHQIEIIVIDDASTDSTAQIALEQAKEDSRVRVIRLEANGGPAVARNRGISEANGEWIALLDADDTYAPARLSTLLQVANADGADMVADNIVLRDAASQAPDTPMIPRTLLAHSRRLDIVEFIERNVGTPDLPRLSFGFLKPILRTSFLRTNGIAYDERNRFAEDYMLYIRCLLRGAVWFLVPEPMYYYTVRKGSLTEVQTSGDLLRIRTMDQDLLDDPALTKDPSFVRALRRHKNVIERCYYYRAFTDAIKARRLRTAAQLFFDSRASGWLIAAETGRQAPIILGKALRGGYRMR